MNDAQQAAVREAIRVARLRLKELVTQSDEAEQRRVAAGKAEQEQREHITRLTEGVD